MTNTELIAKVCTFFQIEESELFSKDCTKPLPDARHVLVLNMMKSQAKPSQRRVGKLFGDSKNIADYARRKADNDYTFKLLLNDFNKTL